MNVTYRTDNDIIYIELSGRIDASNAAEADSQITAIKNCHSGLRTVIDADALEYISSAGLRVILKLRKAESDLTIINVSSEVYEILDMTGFTDMVKVEKAYRRLSIDGCEFIAKGANGAVYRYDDETIVKVYFAKDALPEIERERENSRKAFVLGVSTAIPYGVVRVGDGYGMVTELLNAESVSKIICADQNNLELPIKYFVDTLKNVHSVELTEAADFPDMHETATSWVDFVLPHLPETHGKKLKALVGSLPKRNTLLHGDYHTNNILVQNGEPLLIDLDTLCSGHPIFELGSMFNAFVGYAEIDESQSLNFFGFSYDTAKRFWKLSLESYLGTDDAEICRSVEEKAKIIGYTRMLRRSIRRPNEKESAARIEHCKEMLGILLQKVETLDF